MSSFSPSAGYGVGCCWVPDCCLLLCLFLRRWQSFGSVSCRRLPLRGYANFSGSSCLSCSLGGALSLGFPPCAALFFRGLRFWAASPAAGGLPVDLMPGLPLYWWLRLGCILPLCSQCFSCACWGSLGFFTLYLGAPMRAVTALWVTVWGCLVAPHSSRACFLLYHLLLRFSPFVGAVLCSLLGIPCLRVGALLTYGVYSASSLWGLLSRLPLVVGPPSQVSVGPSPALVVGWFGHTSVSPPAAPVLGSCGACCAVMLPWALARPTLSGLRLWIPIVLWSKLLVFSWPLYYGSFLSLPLVTDGSGWLFHALCAGSPTPGWRCVLGMR